MNFVTMEGFGEGVLRFCKDNGVVYVSLDSFLPCIKSGYTPYMWKKYVCEGFKLADEDDFVTVEHKNRKIRYVVAAVALLVLRRQKPAYSEEFEGILLEVIKSVNTVHHPDVLLTNLKISKWNHEESRKLGQALCRGRVSEIILSVRVGEENHTITLKGDVLVPRD